MRMNQSYVSINGNEAWGIIVSYIDESQSFHSVSGIRYQADVQENLISYRGGSGDRGEKGESISRSDFVEAYDSIRVLPEINTSAIKGRIPNSLYRKRTPLIGLLYSAGIIEK